MNSYINKTNGSLFFIVDEQIIQLAPNGIFKYDKWFPLPSGLVKLEDGATEAPRSIEPQSPPQPSHILPTPINMVKTTSPIDFNTAFNKRLNGDIS